MRAIGPPLTPAERETFISSARSYIGTRWRHQGRSRRGVDCAGLVGRALNDVGRPYEDVRGYGRVPYRASLERALENNLGPVQPPESIQAGDVALMRFAGQPSHVGIVTAYPDGGWALVHAFAQMREVVEHRIDREWFDAIVGVFKP